VTAPLPVGADDPKCAQRGGVAAALGREVAPIAEHVCPSAEGLEVSVRAVAKPPRGAYQATLVAVG